jgi:hypothetical protein
MAEPSASPRRRFQFRLRTLMVVVTLLAVPCAYVGWQAKIVRERNAMLRTFGENRFGFYDTPSIYYTGDSDLQTTEKPTVPLIRKWLGDRAVEFIYVPRRDPSVDVDAIRKMFPEATVSIE